MIGGGCHAWPTVKFAFVAVHPSRGGSDIRYNGREEFTIAKMIHFLLLQWPHLLSVRLSSVMRSCESRLPICESRGEISRFLMEIWCMFEGENLALVIDLAWRMKGIVLSEIYLSNVCRTTCKKYLNLCINVSNLPFTFSEYDLDELNVFLSIKCVQIIENLSFCLETLLHSSLDITFKSHRTW